MTENYYDLANYLLDEGLAGKTIKSATFSAENNKLLFIFEDNTLVVITSCVEYNYQRTTDLTNEPFKWEEFGDFELIKSGLFTGDEVAELRRKLEEEKHLTNLTALSKAEHISFLQAKKTYNKLKDKYEDD